MNRRGFVTALGAVLAAPLAAEAQQGTPNQARLVGWLALAPQPRFQAEFVRGMRDLGYVQGSSYMLQERYAEWNADRLPALAADLIRLKLDVIVTEALGPTLAVQRATRTIPIVFITGDPVASGLAQSLARPGGNLTGVSNLSLELYPKRVEVLKSAVPSLRRLAMFFGPTVQPERVSRMAQDAARTESIEALSPRFMSQPEELESAFAQAVQAGAGAVMIAAHPFFNAHRDRLIGLAGRHRLPAQYEFRDFVEAGGFMCYGADMNDVFRRVATYVDRILKGAKPAELPVEQPTKFELIINLKTAKALGLTIPQSILVRADEIIE